MDIHDSKNKLKTTIEKLKKDPKITNRNKQLILDFIDYILADGLSQVRALKYIYTLKQISKILNKDFNNIKKKEICL